MLLTDHEYGAGVIFDQAGFGQVDCVVSSRSQTMHALLREHAIVSVGGSWFANAVRSLLLLTWVHSIPRHGSLRVESREARSSPNKTSPEGDDEWLAA